jgi:hypothetical protein
MHFNSISGTATGAHLVHGGSGLLSDEEAEGVALLLLRLLLFCQELQGAVVTGA